MKKHKAGAVAVAALMAGTAIALSDDKHVHVELRTEPAATSTNFIAGGQSAFFDNEAFAPAMPWASWMPGFKFPEHLVSLPAQLAMMTLQC